MNNATNSNIAMAEVVSQNFPNIPIRPNSLNEQQQTAIRLLVTGKSPASVAELLGINRRTLYNWRQTAEFRRELSRLRRQLWSEAADRLRALVHPSLDVLEQELRKGYDRARYRAANAVLRHANLRKSIPLDADEPELEEEFEE